MNRQLTLFSPRPALPSRPFTRLGRLLDDVVNLQRLRPEYRRAAPAGRNAAAHPLRAKSSAGKRSNPAWKQHTVMLEKETHLAALDILRRQDNGTDVSDLLNALLADWVREHQAQT